jgi:signal peptidase I
MDEQDYGRLLPEETLSPDESRAGGPGGIKTPEEPAGVGPQAVMEVVLDPPGQAQIVLPYGTLSQPTGAFADPAPVLSAGLSAEGALEHAVIPFELPVVPPIELPAPRVRAAEEPPQTQQGVGAWTRMGRELLAGVQTLVSAAVYATLIVTFGFQVARVDGLSMAPTLEDHDRLIVNKLVYELGDPRPGDIVMLYYPLNPEKMFVKRVIAKEGDTVRIVDGHVYVNDIPLRDDYVPVEFRSHDDWGPQVIQQGYYFVMGDHRNNSSDSRHWGPVPKKYIVGKVKVRWWPIQDARIF